MYCIDSLYDHGKYACHESCRDPSTFVVDPPPPLSSLEKLEVIVME
jgi:hypothetical protein